MGPRKRPKPNPKAETESRIESDSPKGVKLADSSSSNAIAKDTSKDRCTQPELSTNPKDGGKTPPFNKTWYGGTWSKKATPVTQIAKESISAAGGAAAEAITSGRTQTSQAPATPLKSPTIYLSRSKGSSSRSLPLAAATTKLNITSNGQGLKGAAASEAQLPNPDVPPQDSKSQPNSKQAAVEKSGAPKLKQSPQKLDGYGELANDELKESSRSNRDSTSWLTWFSKVDGMKDQSQAAIVSKADTESGDRKKKDNVPTTLIQTSRETQHSSTQRRNSDPSPVSSVTTQEQPSRTWLSLWGTATPTAQKAQSASASVINTSESTDSKHPLEEALKPDGIESEVPTAPDPAPQSSDTGKSVGWAFWSKSQPTGDGEKKNIESNTGELASAGSTSQSKPEAAVVDETKGVPKKIERKRRPQSLDASCAIQNSENTDDVPKKDSSIDLEAVTPKSKSVAEKSLKAKRVPENLLLPAFKRTYSTIGRPSFVQQLSRLLQLGSPQDMKHVAIAQNPHRIKKALAIGIHGYFPAPLIRSVLGQPTGTSLRFANGAANAISRWVQAQGYSCEIEKVALEGEGKIAERTDLLWKLLLNWIEKIRRADFVLFACHSQGVPVAMMLVAKLVAFGCVNSAKIGVCAMAGVNLGPFADYKSRWIGGSAGELFDFAQADSQVSKDYETALDVALSFGVKIVYIGSIDDQLVSLESSTFGTVDHPYIYRAVFIDGRIHAPDFLTHLVGFALKLRNLGISDHGLIRELSTPLAGSLYTGEGHSRIYDDEAVYYLAVEHALETTTLGNIPMQSHRKPSATAQNPYILPFAMRGLLEEEYVRTELHEEITELIEQFDDWKPSSKVLKDVKFRLEGVRSKL